MSREEEQRKKVEGAGSLDKLEHRSRVRAESDPRDVLEWLEVWPAVGPGPASGVIARLLLAGVPTPGSA